MAHELWTVVLLLVLAVAAALALLGARPPGSSHPDLISGPYGV